MQRLEILLIAEPNVKRETTRKDSHEVTTKSDHIFNNTTINFTANAFKQ